MIANTSHLRVAYVTLYDPNDQRQWSGLGHAIMHALREQDASVTPFGPLRSRLDLVKGIAERVHRVFSRKYYEFQRERVVAWDYALQVSRKLAAQSFDVVFAPGAPIPISSLSCRQPIVLWSGATFGALIDHYGFVHGNCRASIRAGHRMERSALARASLLLFASDWAANSAIRDYDADPSKVKIVPFGANLRSPPARAEVLRHIAARPTDRCHLISVGVEWERKGIPRVIELAAALNERGVPADLTVVGCSPPEPRKLPPWVTVTGMIDKDAEGGERRLGDLFARSHFHVLLSSAECFGLAFCEANAWGVPNLAADVGGIPTAVRHGKGGWRFDGAQSIASMADFVAKQFGDRSGYPKAAERARDEYETRLNWQVAGKTAMDHVRSMFDFEQLPKRSKG